MVLHLVSLRCYGVHVNYTARALGLAIRDLREQHQMSQEVLGAKAGYSKGAGVSISRIEAGTTQPTRPRLVGIAGALGVTLERLEDLAKIRADETTGVGTESETSAPGRKRGVRDRLKAVQERTKLRTDRVKDLGSSFNHAHDLARDAYFLRFVGIAEGIKGAPLPPANEESSGPDDGAGDARATVAGMSILSRKITAALVGGAGGAAAGAAVGGAAAYATFTAVARFGTASTGAAISGLSGIAATNATLAVLGGGTLAAGGGGITAGTTVLTSIVAAPIAILLIGGLYLAHRRNKAEEVELSAHLDVAEASLDATQNGFDLLADTLARATAILEYIGVHAAHALEKWERGLGARPISWESLTAEQQQAYRDFIDIAACELAVDSIEAPQLITTQGEELEHLEAVVTATLGYADTTVRRLV